VKKIAIFGGGKMAGELVAAAEKSNSFQLSCLVSRTRPGWLQGIDHFSSLDKITSLPDLLVDFTLTGGTHDAAHWCRASLVPLVSGTTGLSEVDRSALVEAAELVPVMWAPNLSKGLNQVMKSVIEAASTLPADTPVEVLDIHHVHKVDAPSGTALLLARAIAAARGQELDTVLNIISGEKPQEYSAGSINCISRREGEVIGEHRIRFLGNTESLEYRHSAGDRAIYAQGSLEAGLWLVNQPAGLYTSTDWLAT
jgi:4-hydroxy-tetrahydrodipicolinate reductase